ncbi:MAG: class I SAM-dependent RNA methyltransferase [Clostridiales bacterium]|nr:class I SAM-dependent RNA methyltransferase [Clostridiales bacterium]
MSKLTLVATATFGLEAVVKREIEALGYPVLRSEDARILYTGDERALVRSNLWLRSADRVLLLMGEFTAKTFEELFQQTKALPWEEWIPMDGKFPVEGVSVKSTLHSVPDCQAIVKKAVVERLKETYGIQRFPETGANYAIKVSILKDRVSLTMDTSGPGLHKRGYRVRDVAAPIKETLAAAMVQLSFWKEGRLLVDPCCGSGTIPIEAAMIAKNIAPGLGRKFASEGWEAVPAHLWKEERKAAFAAMDYDKDVRIRAFDIDERAIKAAAINAREAGVDDCIEFRVLPVQRLHEVLESEGGAEPYSIMIANPPYGERIGEKKEIREIYKALTAFFSQEPTWSLYLVTSDKEFEKLFREKPADRRRKLYNGRLEICYYQYYGLKPPRKEQEEA